MRTIRSTGRLCVLLLGAWAGLAWMPLTTAGEPVVVPDRVIPLFNGRDLSGWKLWLVDSHGEDPRGVFGVTNGCLRVSGDGLGYLRTDRVFRDYHLVVEYRWGQRNWPWNNREGRARDSGVFVHARGPDGNSHDGGGAFMAAIECNLFEGAVGDFLLIRGDAADGSLIAPGITVRVGASADADGWPWWDPDGLPRRLSRWGRVNRWGKSPGWRDVTSFSGPGDLEHPPGEWNRVDCLCEGDRITVLLNGVRVNSARDVWPDSGRVLLQCEGSEIWFRRVEMHPVGAFPQ